VGTAWCPRETVTESGAWDSVVLSLYESTCSPASCPTVWMGEDKSTHPGQAQGGPLGVQYGFGSATTHTAGKRSFFCKRVVTQDQRPLWQTDRQM
jgi:hypothetical protein